MLAKLCPFFIKPLSIGGEEGFEMLLSSSAEVDEEEQVPSTPSARKGKGREMTGAEEVLIRRPKRVRKEGRGLREVRGRIRRELGRDYFSEHFYLASALFSSIISSTARCSGSSPPSLAFTIVCSFI